MILIGNDIVEIIRIKNLILIYNQNFLNKIFTLKEQQFCQNRSNPYIHYAGKFAAKEAVKKILLQVIDIPLPFNKIEVLRKINFPPVIYINNKKHDNIKVSISHSDHYATAVAITDCK